MTAILELFVIFIFTYNFCDAQNSAELCVPGTTWKEDCNDCHCIDNGNYIIPVCTKKACPTKEHLSVDIVKHLLNLLRRQWKVLQEHLGTANSKFKSMQENDDALLQESLLQKKALQENSASLYAEMEGIKRNLTLMREDLKTMKEDSESMETEFEHSVTVHSAIDNAIAPNTVLTEISTTTEQSIAMKNLMLLDNKGCLRVFEVGSDIFFFCSERKSYYKAKEFCAEWGGHLAEPSNPLAVIEKLDNMTAQWAIQIKGWFISDKFVHGTYWVGAQREAGVWKWKESGIVIPNNSPLWLIPFAPVQNCAYLVRHAQLHKGQGVLKNDNPCHFIHHPLCQLN